MASFLVVRFNTVHRAYKYFLKLQIPFKDTLKTSVISIMVGHFDYKHRCLVEKNVPIVLILPSRWCWESRDRALAVYGMPFKYVTSHSYGVIEQALHMWCHISMLDFNYLGLKLFTPRVRINAQPAFDITLVLTHLWEKQLLLIKVNMVETSNGPQIFSWQNIHSGALQS